MSSRNCCERFRSAAVLFTAVVLNGLLLIGPLLLVTGWRGVNSNPRLATFLLVASVWCVVEGIVGRSRSERVRPAAGPRWLPLAIGLAVLCTFWIALADAVVFSRAPSFVAVAAGGLLMATGITVRILAIRRLGAFFLNEVSLLPGQPLVTDGIYGAVRHPSEAGTLCLAFGGAMVLGSLAAVLACVFFLLPFVVWRTRLEDRVLRERHGVAFERYVRAVRSFMPAFKKATNGMSRDREGAGCRRRPLIAPAPWRSRLFGLWRLIDFRIRMQPHPGHWQQRQEHEHGQTNAVSDSKS